jgi:UDP-N-acetylglucosamine--N-acetylmuramyl-(pentapeptide) pyrophosphoryl-undecaprenol N-acetylglucosamine transferase
MKILFTGGGTGGHFYPIIAVAQEIKKIVEEDKLVEPKLYYMSDTPYNETVLYENGITYVPEMAGKTRRYFSILNFLDLFKTAWGVVGAFFKIFFIFPDVVFSKGGYASFPAIFAARLLGIPVIIHESDTMPGRANLWAGKFAKKIALSYPGAQQYFPKDKTAVTGNPIRKEIMNPIRMGAHEFLALSQDLPVLFIVGGSQGAVRINDTVFTILPKLLERYQIVHQVGKANHEEFEKRAELILRDSPYKDRYKIFPYLNNTAMRMVAGVADLVVSRAGSSIFEIAHWGIPSIIIPIPESISHDQKTNAFTFARAGCCIVIEEENLTPSVLLSEINRLMDGPALRREMTAACKNFDNPDAGRTIARALLDIALQHEK